MFGSMLEDSLFLGGGGGGGRGGGAGHGVNFQI